MQRSWFFHQTGHGVEVWSQNALLLNSALLALLMRALGLSSPFELEDDKELALTEGQGWSCAQ